MPTVYKNLYEKRNNTIQMVISCLGAVSRSHYLPPSLILILIFGWRVMLHTTWWSWSVFVWISIYKIWGMLYLFSDIFYIESRSNYYIRADRCSFMAFTSICIMYTAFYGCTKNTFILASICSRAGVLFQCHETQYEIVCLSSVSTYIFTLMRMSMSTRT